MRDLLAYLRVVANPADGVSLARMFGAPKRGLGPGCIAKLEAFAAAQVLPIGETLLRPDEVAGLQPAQRATIVLLVDVSGSMRARDVRPSRLGAAQAAMASFLERVPPSDKVGLVSFSS